ncbi:MAG: SUMF1/EgtB/PvdO family nonheme iron enzyme [Chitinispirillaceae bacterium]|nr:SUMF1/EgtB/PvdO family nonheme iron enzyme [Chitinispirillaceae bacterium]
MTHRITGLFAVTALFVLSSCMSRSNPYDPDGPRFIDPTFYRTLQFRDKYTEQIIDDTVVCVYQYGGNVDTVKAYPTQKLTVKIKDNLAVTRVCCTLMTVAMRNYTVLSNIPITLFSEMSDTVIYLTSEVAFAVKWDMGNTGINHLNVQLQWYASGSDFFSFYRLLRTDPDSTSDTLFFSGNRDDTVCYDSTAEENSWYKYNVTIGSLNGEVQRSSDLIMPIPNKPPSYSDIHEVTATNFTCLHVVWEQNRNDDFERYIIYRSTDSLTFDSVFTLTEQSDTERTDMSIEKAGQHCFYFVETIDDKGLAARGNTVSGINRIALDSNRILVYEREFTMGRNHRDGVPFNEEPEHVVYVSTFLIDRYEVTIDRYVSFLNNGNGTHYHDMLSRIGIVAKDTLFSYEPAVKNLPVTFISWNDAEAYCNCMGGRLPTEAEWEKSARGTDKREYPWGDDFYLNQSPPVYLLANYVVGNSGVTESKYTDDGGKGAVNIGNYLQGISPYGVYEMAGNVKEWCRDWYQTSYDVNDRVDPRGSEFGLTKVIRGGSFKSYPNEMFTTTRSRARPEEVMEDVGFRCVYEKK